MIEKITYNELIYRIKYYIWKTKKEFISCMVLKVNQMEVYGWLCGCSQYCVK